MKSKQIMAFTNKAKAKKSKNKQIIWFILVLMGKEYRNILSNRNKLNR